eukprot:TRINITY_DN16869_c0_g1_i1.p1 TRINITY_DN16869_c0_g1~~TRINITY_DN16869_c0_g1_i1.p1  ORF type:complete len:450 (-),score=142.58 TRINITY_DN16869_c0_g1_i1:256-1605(-)
MAGDSDGTAEPLLSGSDGGQNLMGAFRERQKKRDECGGNLTGAYASNSSFLNLAKNIRDESSGLLKIERELSHDGAINHKCIVMVALALVSILLYIIHMEVNFDDDARYMNNGTASSYVLRFLITFVTALLLCALFDYYQLCVYIYRKYQTPNLEEQHGAWPKQFLYTFAVEAGICLVHPIPGLINNKLGALMLVRIYLLLNLVRNYSEIYRKRGLVYHSGHLKRGGDRVDLKLCLKIQIDEHPASTLGIVAVSLLLIVAYANYICEREGLYGASLTFWGAVWNTSFLLFRGISRVTYDHTAGRAVELVTALVGVLFLGLVVALVTESMEVSEPEKFAMLWMKRLKAKKKGQVYAAELIQAAWRLHQLKAKCPDEVTIELEMFFDDLWARHRKYREDCETQDNLSLDVTHDKALEMSRKLKSVREMIDSVKKNQVAGLEAFDELDDAAM